MPIVSSKGSYLAELIHELTNLEIDDSNLTRHGEFVDDEDINVRAIRASKYSSGTEDSTAYSHYINNIVQQALTEVTFLYPDECSRLLKRFDFIAERFDKAWELYFIHFDLFYKNSFSSLQFEWSFYHLFNIPVRRGGAMDAPNFDSLRTTGDFWSDLHDALMYKQGALLWITHYIRDLYGIAQPTDEKEPAGEEVPSPDKSFVGPNPEQMRRAVRAILAPLSRVSPQKRRIMSEADYARLLEYTDYLVIHDKVPSDIEMIQQFDISKGHISYTFHRLHDHLFGTRPIRQTFIDFLHEVFKPFGTEQKSTTRGKFGSMPNSYLRDFNIS